MFSLDRVVPWGRSFDEYQRMFVLSDDDLKGRILGCADGPASFNAVASTRGARVVSCDPIYKFTPAAIRVRIELAAPDVLQQARQNRHEFVWTDIPSVEELSRIRHAAMEAFLRDYEQKGTSGRYVAGTLPTLPFASGAFDLALCSHFLFLYSERFDAEFHLESLLELCRVAREVRIYPLLMHGSRPSPHLKPATDALRRRGYKTTVETVPYEFQRGGNQMLRVLPTAP